MGSLAGQAWSKYVSDRIYKRMCYRDHYLISSQDTPGVTEVNELSFPSVIHWIIGGKAVYRYSYGIFDEAGKLRGGSWDIPVTVFVELKDWDWVITDYHEPP